MLHRKSKKSGCRPLLATLLFLGLPAYGAAQPEKTDLLELSLEELQQIRVTVASPFRESDLVVGSTVALISEKDWQLAGARRTSDAIGHLPSTMVMPTVFGGDAIAIRGYGQTSQGLATLIDGVPVNNFATGSAQFGPANFSLGSLKNIEMIRGPGSAIYGSDAFHGVFALNTFEAEEDTDQLDANLSSKGYYQGSLRDSRELGRSVRANISLSASGQGDQDRGYSYSDNNGLDQTASRDMNYDSQTAVIKLVSEEEQPWSYRWGLYWDSYKADQFAGFGRALSGDKSALGAQDWSGSDTRFAMTNLSIARQLPYDITAQLNNFYWRNTTLWSYYRPSSLGEVGEAVTDLVNSRQGSELLFKQADNAWQTQWVAAIGYNKMQVNEAGETAYAADGSLLANSIFAYDGLDRTIKDAYLQARTSLFNERLQLLYGGRIDDYSDFGVKRTPRVGIIFLPEPDRAYKLLYGEAFRAPIATELTRSSFIKGNPDLKPETSKSLEFTYMRRWDASKLELTLFKNLWRYGITTMPSSDPDYRLEYGNVSKNMSRGLELSYQLINSHWLTDLSASYVKSENELTETVYGVFPRVILNAGFGYQLDSGWQVYLNNRFFTDAKAGPNNSAIAHPASLESYWRADFHLGKELSQHLQMSLDIKNLLDRQNYLPSVLSAEEGYRDEPFNASVGMSYKF